MSAATSSSLLPASGAVAFRHLRQAFTTPSLLMPPLVAPLVFFAAFAGALGGMGRELVSDHPGGYTSFAFVWVLMQGAMFTGLFVALGLARDFETGVASRLIVGLDRRAPVIVGYLGAAITRVLVSMGLLFAVALLVGMEVSGDPLELAGLGLLAVAAGLTAALWGIGVAVRLQTVHAAPLFQVPVFLTLFLCPTFVPLDDLSGWLHAAARVNPVTWFLEAGRGLLAGSTDDLPNAVIAAVIVLTATALWAAIGLLKVEVRR